MRFWSNLSIKIEKVKNPNIYEGNCVAWIIQQLLFRDFDHMLCLLLLQEEKYYTSA